MDDRGSCTLVGRAEELELIAEALKGSRAFAGVAIVGAVGVGKSRLAREAVAASGHAVVHWAAGSTAARSIPLGAFVSWLPGDTRLSARTLERMVAELVGHARDRVVGVDDAHLLDDTSAFVLHRLVERRMATVVLTVRGGVPVPDSVAALWRGGALQRLDLQPLGRRELGTLLEAILRAPMDPVSERRLWQLTRGNVRFARDIVDLELNAGRIRCCDGTWTWSPGSELSLSVCELVEHVMGDLPDAVADAVDLVGLAGSLPVRTLVDMVGTAAAEEAEVRSLIVIDDGDQPSARLAHPLYGEVRRLRAGRIRMRRLRGTLALRIGHGPGAEQCVRRAALLLDSDVDPTAHDMLCAARAALWRGDGRLALTFARRAEAAGGRGEAVIAQVHALNMIGRVAEAAALLPAGDVGSRADTHPVLAHAHTCYLCGGIDEADDVLRRWPGDDGAVEAMRAFVGASGGQLTRAVRLADAAMAQPGLDDAAVLTATIATVIAKGEAGAEYPASLAARAAALGIRSASTSFLRFALAEAGSSALILQGRPDAAMAVIDGVRDDDQPADLYAWVSMMTGAVNVALGRLEEAVGQIRDVMAATGPQFLAGWLCRYRFDLAIALAIRGQPNEATACLNRFGGFPHPAVAYLHPMELLAQAWISAASGSVTEAISQARAAAAEAAAHGQSARETLCLQTATRFGDKTTAFRLSDLAGTVSGPRVGAAAAHAIALAAGDGCGLMAASERYEAIADPLSAADAAAQASAVFSRLGRRGSALGAVTRMRAIAERCDVVHTPAIAAAGAPAALTEREREVISLAGRGLTNRQIAERLQLSVRTVEGHLYRAAERLGAHDRRELAQAIGDSLGATA